MRDYHFSQDETEYIKEIHTILKNSEFPKLYYVIGINKHTGQRKIFIFHEDANGNNFAIAEVLNDKSDLLEENYFQQTDKKDITYTYGKKQV